MEGVVGGDGDVQAGVGRKVERAPGQDGLEPRAAQQVVLLAYPQGYPVDGELCLDARLHQQHGDAVQGLVGYGGLHEVLRTDDRKVEESGEESGLP